MKIDVISNLRGQQLPQRRIERFSKLFAGFLNVQAVGGVVLLLATIVAIALVNSPAKQVYLDFWATPIGLNIGAWSYTHSLKDWINDGLMTFFFFLVSIELKRELILGELKNARVAALSFFAASGGMIVPAALYLMLQWGEPGQQGWGTVMATDTAFVVCCLALMGKQVPNSLRVFMLSLAIVDDIGAILVVALGYSSVIHWAGIALFFFAIGIVQLMARMGVRTFPPYFFVGGFVWLGLESSGIHATVTGVVLGLMTPARRWVSDQRLYSILSQVVSHPNSSEHSGNTKDRATLQIAEIAARESLSAVERLQIGLHPWVAFAILPLFALANAGLSFSVQGFGDSVTWAVFSGFVLGKPLGILLCSLLAIKSGMAEKSEDLSWGFFIGGSLLTGIGFTMALLIADLAFQSALLESARLGILLASIFSAVAGVTFLKLVAMRRASKGQACSS